MKKFLALTIFLMMTISCSSSGKDSSKGKLITDPKIGEWAWFEGYGKQDENTLPDFKAQACQLQTESKYDTDEWMIYNCSLEGVKEKRMSYRRYATQEEIKAVLPLK